MNQPSSKPLFIVGVFRSGTSLLHSLLNQHPQIGLMYESDAWNFPQPFNGLRFRRNWLQRLEFYNQCLSRHRLIYGGSLRGLEQVRTPDDLYQVYAAGKESAWWGEKSPVYCTRLNGLNRQYPEAPFILVWRNPVETYRSVVKAGKTSRYFRQRGMLSRLIYHQEEAIRQSALIEQRGARVYRVNYDELVTRPEQVCRDLCAFLNVQFDHEMLKLEKADLTPVYRGEHHEFLRRGIIERQKYTEQLLPLATVNKLSRYRARWERLQKMSGPSERTAGRSAEPGWLERAFDRLRGRTYCTYDHWIRLCFEFLPLPWLMTYRQFKTWVFNRPSLPASEGALAGNESSAKFITLLAALLYTAGVAVVHLHSDPHMMFIPFYIFPCIAVALIINLRWATFFAVATSLVGPLIQYFGNTAFQSPGIMVWNCVMRFVLVEFVVLLFSRIRLEMGGSSQTPGRN